MMWRRFVNLSLRLSLLKIGFNSGVHALNIGISLALRSGAELILLLDQDSYVGPEAVKKVLRIFERLHKDTLNKIAIIIAYSKYEFA